MAVILNLAVRNALQLLKEVEEAGGFIDMQSMVNMAVEASRPDNLYYKAGLLVIVCCWLFSIIDAWRTGEGGEAPKK